MASKTKVTGKFRIRKIGPSWFIEAFKESGMTDRLASRGPFTFDEAKTEGEAMELKGWKDWDKDIKL